MIIKYALYASLAFIAIICILNIFFATVNIMSPHTKNSSEMGIIIGCTFLVIVCGLFFYFIKDSSPEQLNEKLSSFLQLIKTDIWWFAGAFVVMIISAALMGLPWAAPMALFDMIFGFLNSKIPGFPLIKAKDYSAMMIAITMSFLGPWLALLMSYGIRHYQIVQGKGTAVAISTLVLILLSYVFAFLG